MTFMTPKKRSKATMVSKSMKSDSGTWRTSSMGLAVRGSKYRTQS